MKRIADYIQTLEDAHCRRRLPEDLFSATLTTIDFTSNDYLGLAGQKKLQDEFLADLLKDARGGRMSASAARLLAPRPECYAILEKGFASAYGLQALAFNSGYHANVGMLSALGDKDTLIVADKLIHASCIDGAMMSRATFRRFNHNDMSSLERILSSEADAFARVVIVVESVYSMDGDMAPLEEICRIKSRYAHAMLYVDEAHALGVMGPEGLGLTETLPSKLRECVDIRVLTLGKALCSAGAVVILPDLLKSYMVNKARSFIFSTALPAVNVLWSLKMFDTARGMDSGRRILRDFYQMFVSVAGVDAEDSLAGHIIPWHIGDAGRALRVSGTLLDKGFKVMAIRPPTVAAGTERLRISLSAGHDSREVMALAHALNAINTAGDVR